MKDIKLFAGQIVLQLRKREIFSHAIKLVAIIAGFSIGLCDKSIAQTIEMPLIDSSSYQFNRKEYKPAIIRLSISSQKGSQELSLDTILIPNEGEPIGVRTQLNRARFGELVNLQFKEISGALPLKPGQSNSSSRELYKIIFGNIEKQLKERKITTLLISLDPELQRIPFAALHTGTNWFSIEYSHSITPSISLMPEGSNNDKKEVEYLLAGSSQFQELSPLPYVEQEINQISEVTNGKSLINSNFTKEALIDEAYSKEVQMIHMATHGEFIPGRPEESKLYLSQGSISMSQLREMRLNRKDWPLELLSLSACRTALGDNDRELGLSGLALLAGAQSAIGTLWYVDDIASSIFFIRFYYWLEQGLPKAEAVQQVQREFISNMFRVKGNNIYSPQGDIMIENIKSWQLIQVKRGLSHPYYWSAPVLIGKPW